MKYIRKPATRLLFVALLLAALLLSLSGCQTRKPDIEVIYDDAVALIEASYALNDMVFGQGLPVWALDSSYATQMNIYQGRPFYAQVTQYSSVSSVAGIKEAMEAVYSTDYLASIYVPLFDGYAYEEGAIVAQLHEDSTRLYQRADYTPLLEGQRIYDYSTMRVLSGNESYIVVAIDTHLEHEERILTVELAFVLEEHGWRLDTPTY